MAGADVLRESEWIRFSGKSTLVLRIWRTKRQWILHQYLTVHHPTQLSADKVFGFTYRHYSGRHPLQEEPR